MTDTPNERNLHYPLDVEFKREESRDFLVEKGIINNKLFTNDLYEVSEDRHEEYFSIRLVEKNLFELKS